MKINISIDDVSPHPLSSTRVIDRCHEVIQHFPKAKFTLFVPIAYWRTIRQGVTTPQALSIDKYPEFCEFIKQLPSSNFEICYHGFFHGIPGENDNDEFHHLDEAQARQKFSSMFDIVKKSGLQDIFKPVFRPPAWRMSPSAIKVAEEVGIKTLALSPADYAKQTYASAEEKFPHVVYFNCVPPFKELETHPVNEIVYHACEWDKNYLSVDMTKQLIDWLKKFDNLDFCFIQDL